ncbi:MAG: 6-phosphofructokinase [Planctomycetota bacterium]
MSQLKGNVVVGQSGGPTCVINSSLIGLIREAAQHDALSGIYGALHGVQGILREELIDLRQEKATTLDAVAKTPAAGLGSVRKKPTTEDCERILEVFKAHDVRYFFYIGGNDTSETAHIVHEMATRDGYEMRLFHVPKTIDNDLMVTDHCPGFGSAARFVAHAVMGDNLDNRSLPGIKIDVVMGRHAGFLTAASVLARQHEDDGPHLIYVPERVFSMERFLEDVATVYERLGRCVIAVSEGIHDAQGKLIVQSSEVDSHGNVQLSGSGALGDLLANVVREKLESRFGKLRVRADTFGYLQRSFPSFASDVDLREAEEAGRAAVRAAMSGKHLHGSIAIRRHEGDRYSSECFVTSLESVAGKTKTLADDFIEGDNDITPAFVDYVRPLVGELFQTARFEGHRVPKKLT